MKAGRKVKAIAERFQVMRKTVHNVKSVYLASGDFSDCKKTRRPHTTWIEANIAAVMAKIDEHPRNSIRKITREIKLPQSSVSAIVWKDLGPCNRSVQKF